MDQDISFNLNEDKAGGENAESGREESNKKNKKPDFEDLSNKYKHALADYQNLLKRTAKEKQDFAKYANEQFILGILPVYNNLKIALEHINRTVDNSWVEGIKFVLKQFKEVLNNFGVEEIKAKGEKFDPQIMEALQGKGEKVKKEVQPGYKLNGKVIIAAKVILE